jgi:hypothetical protein
MKEQGHTEKRSRLREGRNCSDPGDGGRVPRIGVWPCAIPLHIYSCTPASSAQPSG